MILARFFNINLLGFKHIENLESFFKMRHQYNTILTINKPPMVEKIRA